MIIDGVRNMKRLCAILLFISIVMTGCTAGHPGGSTSAEGSTSSAAKAELTEYTSESLGIRFELDSDWVVDEKPSESRLYLTWGNPNVTVELYVVEGYLDLDYYTEDVVTQWLKNDRNGYYENEYTGEIITGLMEEISSFKSEYNQQGLDCISVRDMYSVQTQHTNGETDSYTIREMNGWVGLSDDTVLVLCCGGTDESGISDDYFEKIEELIDSVDRSGEPLDCYDSWGELVDPSLYDAKTA